MMTPEEQKDWDEWVALRNAANIETKAITMAPEFKSRLLIDYDTVMRAKRANPLGALADAFGWHALARPWAAASLGAAMVMLGAFVGAATASGASAREEEAYAYLSAALDPAFDLTEEVATWADQ